MVILVLVFWAITILFSIVAIPTYIPTNSVKGFHFSTSLPTFVTCLLFDNSHSEMWGDILRWFWFTFSWCLRCWVSFYVPDGHLDFLFRKYIFSSSAWVFFLSCWFIRVVYICWIYIIQSFTSHIICQYFLPFTKLSFHDYHL